MPNRADKCPVTRCVGTLKPAGPPFTDQTTSPAERKVIYRCSECGYSEERSAEPLNIDHGEGEE